MTTATLYDGQTGEPLLGDETDPPDPVVSADDHSGVTFALDPLNGTALVQFVADPGSRRLVAGLEVGESDDLRDIHRAIQEQITGSEYSMAPPGTAPPHLNVFHYLAAPDPTSPDPGIRGHLVATDDPIEVAAPTAAEAASVVAFFRDRAPWKVVAIHGPGTTVGSADADVAVAVDDAYDEVTFLDREESWVDEDAVPDDPQPEGDATTSGADADGPAAASGEDQGGQPTEEAPVLRIYDGTTGELRYDSRRSGDVPATVNEGAKRVYGDGLALYVDPAGGVLRATLEARRAGVDTAFVVEYDRNGPGEDLLGAFVEELAERVDDLGVEFAVDAGDDAVALDALTTERGDAPGDLSGGDLAWLDRTEGPHDFAAPGGSEAVALATALRHHLDDDRSIAVCAAGRTHDLATVDVVVTIDPDSETVEPLGTTATALADRRLQERLTDVGGAVEAMVGRVDEVTGSLEARQRIFAAALSGDVLARRGLTVAPVDDSPIGRRRRQARSLVLYALVLVGLAWGVHVGQFEPLAALPAEAYSVQVELPPGSPLAPLAGTWVAEGPLVVGGSLAATAVGAYWLFGYPLGPLAAARALVGTVWRQVTGGVGSGTVPSTVRSLADPIQSSIEDLGATYDRLADSEGTTAARSEDFAAFLEQHLLGGPAVPQVRLVSRNARWRRLLAGVARGAIVGAALGVALLGAGWFATHVVQADPTLGHQALLGLAGLTVLASLVKGVALRYGRGRPPRWSTTR